MNIYQKYPEGYYVYYYLRNKDSSRANTGTPYYVGKGNGKRAWSYHTKTVRVPKDKSLIIIVAEGLTEEQAFKIECLHIRLWGRIDLTSGILHNKTNGGDGASGVIKSDATRRKTSLTLKGRPGRKQSAYTCQLIGQRNKERVLTPDAEAKMLANLEKGRGKKTEATKQKMSETKTGIPLSEQHKSSLKTAWQTRDRTPHNKGKTSPKVSCVHCRRCISASHITTHQKYHCS